MGNNNQQSEGGKKYIRELLQSSSGQAMHKLVKGGKLITDSRGSFWRTHEGKDGEKKKRESNMGGEKIPRGTKGEVRKEEILSNE